MSAKIKIISINIEMNRHIDTVLRFIETEKPDVVCLQELLERDFPRALESLGMKGVFAKMATLTDSTFESEVSGLPFGVAIFSRYEMRHTVEYYIGSKDVLPPCVEGNGGNKVLLSVYFSADGKPYTVGTTHFTWTPDGEASEEQRADMKNLLSTLSKHKEIVFCGDFNAPRGREMWGEIAKKYHDNIPALYNSSLDPTLHRAGELPYVVDGLFSTPDYRVTDVRLEEGISDHKAIVGFIEKGV